MAANASTPEVHTSVQNGDFAPMLEAMTAKTLLLPRCEGCESWIWPPTDTCRTCGEHTVAWTEVIPATSTLFSYTVVWHTRLPGYTDRTPYVVGIVEVAETGIRLIGSLEAQPDSQLSLGQPLAAIYKSSPDGTPIVCWAPT